MKVPWRYAVAGLLMILLSLCPLWLTDAQAGPFKTYENAFLQKIDGETLAFLTDRDGRIWPVKGRLSDRTKIRDGKGKKLDSEALTTGSLWTVKLDYSGRQEGLPVIRELSRVRAKTPE
jgi:hypothetical protein